MSCTLLRLATILAAALAACGGSEEAATIQLPVTTTAGPPPAFTTDLGYTITLTSVRAAIADVQFTIEGEQHAAARIAPPHPGHSAGSEVTGELPSRFILRWDAAAPTTLGLATLIVGDYQGANFGFRAADQSDGLAADDPLVGHALHVTGTVERDGATTAFDAVLDVEVDTAMIGAPFAAVITETATAPLAIAFSPTDPTEGDTAFDGLDFATLPVTAGFLQHASFADYDGDGSDNQTEWIMGSNPAASVPRGAAGGPSFLSLTGVGGAFQAGVVSRYPGRTYVLQFNDTPGTDSWSDVPGLTALHGEGADTWSLSGPAAPARLYRLGVTKD